MDMKKVDQYRKNFLKMPDEALHGQMHQWVPHSEMHLAAKLLLAERREKKRTM